MADYTVPDCTGLVVEVELEQEREQGRLIQAALNVSTVPGTRMARFGGCLPHQLVQLT